MRMGRSEAWTVFSTVTGEKPIRGSPGLFTGQVPRFTVGSVTTAIFGILNGGMQIGQSSMYVEAVATAKAAAVQIFHVIDR